MKKRPIVLRREELTSVGGGTIHDLLIRPLKNQPPPGCQRVNVVGPWFHIERDYPYSEMYTVTCPYGVPGDELWVRETWALVRPWIDSDSGYMEDVYEWGVNAGQDKLPAKFPSGWSVWYSADSDDILNHPDDRWVKRYLPPMAMPQWASRLTYEIMSVMLGKIQDVTESEAVRAGFHPINGSPTARAALEQNWKERYGEERWNLNPWVWLLGVNGTVGKPLIDTSFEFEVANLSSIEPEVTKK